MSDAVEKHQILLEIKELANQLGRTPTRAQAIQKVRNLQARLDNHFDGSYVKAVDACGLAPTQQRRIDNSIFNKDIGKHIQSYKQNISIEDPYPRLSIISDIHWPFHSQRVVDKFLDRISKTNPQYIILNGDGWDMYSHSKFPRSHNVFTPRDEQELCKKLEKEFWEIVHKSCPQAKKYRLLGNHDIRPLKRIIEEYPEAEDWVGEVLKKLFTFDNVETIFDSRQELIIGNIMIHHGYRSKLGDHRDYVLYNTIVGHTHLAGIVYRRLMDKTIWEMNSGFAGDPRAKGLTYTPQKFTNWTPAFAEVSEEGPRVILC